MRRSARTLVPAVILRAFVFTLVWLALSGASADYLLYGLVVVPLVTATSLWLISPSHMPISCWPQRAYRGAGLLAWFLKESFVGGFDVARRVLRPQVDVDPAVAIAPLALPPGHCRHLALLMINLMPGTMVQRVITDPVTGEARGAVELHTLSMDLHPSRAWRELEERVGHAFGVKVATTAEERASFPALTFEGSEAPYAGDPWGERHPGRRRLEDDGR